VVGCCEKMNELSYFHGWLGISQFAEQMVASQEKPVHGVQYILQRFPIIKKSLII
jgi:hypothetical protein